MHPHPVALVTGGSRGIGRSICQELSRAGYAIAINYAVNEAAARETAASLATDSIIVQADVGNSNDRARLIKTVLDQWGRLDLLVNNAGIASPGRLDLLDATEAAWDQVLDTNLKGPYFLSQLAARAMIDLGPALPQPAIIFVTSISAAAASTNRGDYCVSKAGLAMAAQLFAVRLAEANIRVYEVRPGVIETDMTSPVREKYAKLIDEGMAPIRRWGQPDDVGRAVAALAVGAIPFSTGEVIHVDGGFHIQRL